MAGLSGERWQLYRDQFMKTRLCRFNSAGTCNRGDACRFAHGRGELQEMPDLKKTTLCKQWRRGKCKLTAERCQFAHGKQDLHLTPLFAEHAAVQGAPQQQQEFTQREQRSWPSKVQWPAAGGPEQLRPVTQKLKEGIAGAEAVAPPWLLQAHVVSAEASRAAHLQAREKRAPPAMLRCKCLDSEPARVEIPAARLAAYLHDEPVHTRHPAVLRAVIMGHALEALRAGGAHSTCLGPVEGQSLQPPGF